MLKQLLRADSPWTASISSQGDWRRRRRTDNKQQQHRHRQLRSPVDLCRDVPSCQALHQPAAQSISRTDLSKWEERAVPTSLSRPEWGFSFAVNLLINPSPLHYDFRCFGNKWSSSMRLCALFKQKKKKKSFTVVAVNDFGALLHMCLKLFGVHFVCTERLSARTKTLKQKYMLKQPKNSWDKMGTGVNIQQFSDYLYQCHLSANINKINYFKHTILWLWCCILSQCVITSLWSHPASAHHSIEVVKRHR